MEHETPYDIGDELALERERRRILAEARVRNPDRESEIRVWVARLEALVTEAAGRLREYPTRPGGA